MGDEKKTETKASGPCEYCGEVGGKHRVGCPNTVANFPGCKESDCKACSMVAKCTHFKK